MPGITISKDSSGRITVAFPYDPFLVQKIKTIPGHRWHPKEKCWSFPNSDGTLEKILRVFAGEEVQIEPSLESEILNNPSLSSLSPSLAKRGEGRL